MFNQAELNPETIDNAMLFSMTATVLYATAGVFIVVIMNRLSKVQRTDPALKQNSPIEYA